MSRPVGNAESIRTCCGLGHTARVIVAQMIGDLSVLRRFTRNLRIIVPGSSGVKGRMLADTALALAVGDSASSTLHPPAISQ